MAAQTTTAAAPIATPWLRLAVTLTLFDAVATWLWLEVGIATEANPLLRSLVDQVGSTSAMALRAVVGVGLLVALAILAARSRLARHALPAVAIVLAGVAVWHVTGAVSML